MNRRTFLKLTGATAILIATPLIAKTTGPRWIPFTERMPEVGQKIVLTDITGTYLEGAVVADSSDLIRLATDDDKDVTFSVRYVDFVRVMTPSQKDVINYVYSDKGEEVFKTRSWLQTSMREEYSCHRYLHYQRTSARHCKSKYLWLAVDGEYPQTIPEIPNKQKYVRHACYDENGDIRKKYVQNVCLT